ncbi:uncharacterized protein BKA78DRAFT_315760 [Phyllosticta capitalensis]|uniref:uncharacterized protein n=1 Tax=Phyllosticta capitalensis TaxID=121624 RepID=UPI003131474F
MSAGDGIYTSRCISPRRMTAMRRGSWTGLAITCCAHGSLQHPSSIASHLTTSD